MKFLPADKLVPWLEEQAKARKVLAPVQEGDAVVFRPFAKDRPVVLDRQANQPPKGSVFPACETLAAFKYKKHPENLGQVDVVVKETIHPDATLVFGGRPCDARGFLIFDRVYKGKTVDDPYYQARREATVFATLVCTEAENACFCHEVGSSPADAAGSDLLLTPVDGGYVLEAVSERGQALLGSSLLTDAAAKAGEVDAVKQKALADLDEARNLSGAPKALLSLFENMGFWEDVSSKCISCGACTYLCPTCYCFNITDERSGMVGERLRTWDNCMSALFTMEASGHNPRPTKAHRLKNRVGHKFSYYPTIHESIIACCGCGRCIKLCPMSVNIREIVHKALDAAPAAADAPAEPAKAPASAAAPATPPAEKPAEKTVTAKQKAHGKTKAAKASKKGA
ncbi:4Fe-4S dicluster domain-containing protein [Megalodesulfovibrio paquesii]